MRVRVTKEQIAGWVTTRDKVACPLRAALAERLGIALDKIRVGYYAVLITGPKGREIHELTLSAKAFVEEVDNAWLPGQVRPRTLKVWR